MFVLLFVYVLGGAISTPGYSYVDYLIPGIIVQNKMQTASRSGSTQGQTPAQADAIPPIILSGPFADKIAFSNWRWDGGSLVGEMKFLG